jgi:hypothetical protein
MLLVAFRSAKGRCFAPSTCSRQLCLGMVAPKLATRAPRWPRAITLAIFGILGPPWPSWARQAVVLGKSAVPSQRCSFLPPRRQLCDGLAVGKLLRGWWVGGPPHPEELCAIRGAGTQGCISDHHDAPSLREAPLFQVYAGKYDCQYLCSFLLLLISSAADVFNAIRFSSSQAGMIGRHAALPKLPIISIYFRNV